MFAELHPYISMHMLNMPGGIYPDLHIQIYTIFKHHAKRFIEIAKMNTYTVIAWMVVHNLYTKMWKNSHKKGMTLHTELTGSQPIAQTILDWFRSVLALHRPGEKPIESKHPQSGEKISYGEKTQMKTISMTSTQKQKRNRYQFVWNDWVWPHGTGLQ